MMFKTRSYKLVDAIANHPDVRPTIEMGDYYIQSAELISNPNNVVYADENGHGIVIFVGLRPGVYQIHVGFLKHGRGGIARRAIMWCMDDLWQRYDASKIVAAIPLQLRACRLLCRLVGFRSLGADAQQEHFVFEGGQ